MRICNPDRVLRVSKPHCLVRFMQRRLGFTFLNENNFYEWGIKEQVLNKISSLIITEVNDKGVYFADIPNGSNFRHAFLMDNKWVYIVEEDVVLTILKRIKGDLLASLHKTLEVQKQKEIDHDIYQERVKVLGCSKFDNIVDYSYYIKPVKKQRRKLTSA